MSRTNLRRALFVLAVLCFAITVATTEHVISAAGSGLLLGYIIGITYPIKEEATQ